VRASGSLPTILPPFIDQRGHVLVDGGVLDNLPVGVMAGLKAGPNIAVTLDALDENWFSEARYDQIRGPAALLRDITFRRKQKAPFPTLFETTQRSMVVTSRIASRDIDNENNIVITAPRIPNMQILDWHRGRELAELSQRAMTEMIEAQPERFASVKF
jgi:NTE family protein